MYRLLSLQKTEMINHILYGDPKNTYDMWLIEEILELKKQNRDQKDGSTAPEKTKVESIITEGCIEEVLLKVQDSLFINFATRKQKAYMRKGLKNLNGVSMKKVAARLEVLNSDLKRFPRPENTSFSAGKC